MQHEHQAGVGRYPRGQNNPAKQPALTSDGAVAVERSNTNRSAGATIQETNRRRPVTALFVLGTTVFVFGAAFADQPGASTPENPPVVEWLLEPSHSVLAQQDRDFYLRIRLRTARPYEDRPPLNLALVFDRSNSMDADYKIGYLRQAGHLVVDNLTPRDHVALVAYNHNVQTLVPLHPVVNREYLHHRIDELYAEGWTNISGGLLEGCAQLEKRLNAVGRHHVILLTDGKANRGLTDSDELVALVERCSRRGITVSTIGVGTDFAESLLEQMARAGQGRYTYVAEPEAIPTALKDELGALLPIVAQNVKLTMTLPDGVETDLVFGGNAPEKPDAFNLTWSDLASGEERVVLVRFRIDPAVADSTAPLALEAVLTYDDVREARRKTARQTVAFDRVTAGSLQNRTTPVFFYARLVEALDKVAQAVNGMDRDLAAEIEQFRRTEYPELKQAARSSGDQDFVNKAFLFEHYARELQHLIEQDALHEHSRERARLQKELHYRRYLMEHHRHRH